MNKTKTVYLILLTRPEVTLSNPIKIASARSIISGMSMRRIAWTSLAVAT
jgi:hypothetical protein